MSNIDKIRQEIEFLKDLNEGLYTEGDNSYYEGQDNGYNHILAFINSLPEETSCIYSTNELTPTPSVNIENVARVQFASHAHVFDRKRKAVFDWEQFKEVAGIFYGFGKRDSLPEEICKESLQVQETFKENQDSFTDKSKEMSVEETMAYLEEKIAKASKSWEGVDVDKFMDEIRGREPDDLEEAADEWILSHNNGEVLYVRDAFIAGAKWMESQTPMPEDTVIFVKGVAEGRRLEREDRNDDNLPRYYGD